MPAAPPGSGRPRPVRMDTIEGLDLKRYTDLITGGCLQDFKWLDQKRSLWPGNLACYDRLEREKGKTWFFISLSETLPGKNAAKAGPVSGMAEAQKKKFKGSQKRN